MQLAIYGDEEVKPHLGPAGDISGQRWTIELWGVDDNRTFKVTNSFLLPELNLDTYSDTKTAFLGDGDHSSLHWTITPLEPITDVEFIMVFGTLSVPQMGDSF
ncbi:MAG: hypothetical protein M1830_006185, partial [Pleopsidium flavum]